VVCGHFFTIVMGCCDFFIIVLGFGDFGAGFCHGLGVSSLALLLLVVPNDLTFSLVSLLLVLSLIVLSLGSFLLVLSLIYLSLV
jgi:hypothetical protein